MSRQPFSGRTTSRPSTTATTSTAVRNTAIPKPQSTITHDMIARRAYEISQSPQRGSDFENWVRAERELRAGR
jgi:hypothetical protein